MAVKTLNDNAKAILEVLRGSDRPMTLAEISAQVGFKAQPGTMTGLVNNGYAAKGDQVVIETPDTKEASTYVFVTEDKAVNEKGEPYNYSETELAILAVVKAADRPVTIAEIGEALGKKITSGNINALVNKKGNLAKGENVEVPCTKTSKVYTYYAVDAE